MAGESRGPVIMRSRFCEESFLHPAASSVIEGLSLGTVGGNSLLRDTASRSMMWIRTNLLLYMGGLRPPVLDRITRTGIKIDHTLGFTGVVIYMASFLRDRLLKGLPPFPRGFSLQFRSLPVISTQHRTGRTGKCRVGSVLY